MAQFAAMQQSGVATKGPAPAPRRATRRQQQAEIAQHPFVAKAMELFGVEPDKIKFTPPKTD